jgi:hypothetical protein
MVVYVYFFKLCSYRYLYHEPGQAIVYPEDIEAAMAEFNRLTGKNITLNDPCPTRRGAYNVFQSCN